MRRVLVAIGVLLAVAVLFVAIVLTEAHLEIRAIDPPLPDAADFAALAREPSGPVRLSYINTASQKGADGTTLGHPAFLLEWADGRAFLIDSGMDRAGAIAFGKPMEILLASDPTVAYGSVAEQMGPAATSIKGVALTHLHQDHTGGLGPLCDALDRPLPLFQTPWQIDRGNYTTSPGLAHIEAAKCLQRERIEDEPMYSIPGFPGLAAIAAAGHTPGSTMYAARVGDTTWILAGDVSNFMEPLLANQAKPCLYSLLIVPEAPARLDAMRRWLSARHLESDVKVMVSHDGDALLASEIPRWSAYAVPNQ